MVLSPSNIASSTFGTSNQKLGVICKVQVERAQLRVRKWCVVQQLLYVILVAVAQNAGNASLHSMGNLVLVCKMSPGGSMH